MSEFTDKMRAMKCDVDGALERLVDSEEFLHSCVETVLNDPRYERLAAYLEAGEIKKAFEEAHALKGIIGNVGMTDMFNVTCEVVEPLRVGKTEGVAEAYDRLVAMRDNYRKELAEFF